MYILFSTLIGCALFEKQTSQQGKDPSTGTVTSDTGAVTGTGTDTGDTSNDPSDSGDTGTSTGDTGNGGNDTGDDPEDVNNMTSDNTELAQSVDCTSADFGLTDYNYANVAECYTDMISCGDQIAHNTGGGITYYDSDTYVGWYEGIYNKNTDYSGSERAYYFQHPGDGSAPVFTLESPCEDVDILYFKTYDLGDCYDGACGACQQSNDSSTETGNNNDELQIQDTNPNSYLIIVESVIGDDMPFVLTVSCD